MATLFDQNAWLDEAPPKPAKNAKPIALRVLSYGAGKQTFGLLLMVWAEMWERPDEIIFADTQGESAETYAHIEAYAKPIAAELGIPFITLSAGDLLAHSFAVGHTPKPPICSKTYKTRLIEQYLKPKLAPGTAAETWIGISTEEAHRAKHDSEVSYVIKRYPLLEKGLSRDDIIQLIRNSPFPEPPKSGCWYCPWRGTQYWLNMKATDPQRFEIARSLEQRGNHKLPMYGPSIRQMDGQTVMQQWGGTDDTCTTGVCFV